MISSSLLRAAIAAISLSLCGAAGASDFILAPVPGAPPLAPSPASPSIVPEFQFTFGSPVRWPGALLRWKYNHAGAPEPFFSDKAGTIQKIIGASAKWSAVCGIQFAYDGETATPPNSVAGGQPDRTNVVGWGAPGPGMAGITYAWYATQGGARVLADSDVVLSPAYVTSAGQMDRTATHEWGHALGLDHSNLDGSVMSGLPDSPYNTLVDLQPDDARGCRCLYGAAAGQLAAYACSLPTAVDFGVQAVGVDSAPQRVSLVNDVTASAPLTVSGISVASGEFFASATSCVAGAALAPGVGCTIDFIARPGLAGLRAAEAVIATSDGAYRLPLRATGQVGAITPNYQGLWWVPGGAEAYWGVNFAHQGDSVFATWYTYDTSGKAWWLSMLASRTAPTGNTYSGTIHVDAGPPFAAYTMPAVPTAVGNGTLTFGDANNASFEYTVNIANGQVHQTKPLARYVLDGTSPQPTCTYDAAADLTAAGNYQDLWWVPGGAEDGWGVNFAHQGSQLFATWYTYGSDNAPLWLSVLAQRVGTTNAYTGALMRTAGPRFDAYKASDLQPIQTVGTATFTFADGNHATFDYATDGSGGLPAVSQRKPITRVPLAAGGTVCR